MVRNSNNHAEHELWRRRQARREAQLATGLSETDTQLLPLVLALARLAAQRDACVLAQLTPESR